MIGHAIFRSRKGIVISALLGCFVACWIFGSYAVTQYSCLECRATMEKRWLFAIPFHWVVQNSYSREVMAHDPTHQHHWRWCGSTHTYHHNSIIYGCGRMHPIYHLPVEVQQDYAHLVTPEELQKTFLALDIADKATCEDLVARIHKTVIESRETK